MDVCPFSGQPCPHRKVVHVTELKQDGSLRELHLCDSCGTKYMDNAPETMGVQPPESVVEGFDKPSILKTVGTLFDALVKIANNKKQVPITPKIQKKPPCPACGTTLEEVARQGRLGCGECYAHFRNEMAIATSHYHGTSRHTGKQPAHWKEEQERQEKLREQNASLEERIRSYTSKMAKAIEVENYEAAGDLKKLIESLQQQIVIDSETPTPPASGDQ